MDYKISSTLNEIMKTKIIFLALVILISVNLVSSFGVSSPYWKGNPLKMARGETRIVNLNLQNNVGDQDVTVKVEIEEGHEIVSLSRDTYRVRAKSLDTMVPVKVKIPVNASEEGYRVIINFHTVAPGEEGTVSFGKAMQVGFMVFPTEEIAETPQLKLNPWIIGIMIVIIIIIVIVIIIIILKKKKKESEQQKNQKNKQIPQTNKV